MSSLPLDLAQAGLTVGAAAALSGIGLVVCYRATGVLNLAQGAIAMVTAYALRQTIVVWHWPRLLAVPVCLLVFAPAIGWCLDAAVFRRLQRRGAGPVENLVATLGVFVLLVGAAFLLWGPTPLGDAPNLLPSTPWAVLAVVAVLGAAVAAVGRWTPFGTQVRAVVDNRRLAELSGVDADRVSSVGWAFGAFTAGLTGAVLAPGLRLDPYGLPLLVMETMAVAVIAGLRSVWLAVASALALGVLQSELTQFHPGGWAQSLLQAVGANLFALALLAAVLLLPLRFAGAAGGERRAYQAVLTGPPIMRSTEASPRAFAARIGCGALLLLPFAFRPDDLRAALQVPALALVLLSIVVVTGYGGQVSLGQAGYAGLGALFTGLLAGGGQVLGLPAFPAPVALLVAVVFAAPLGLLVGRPAIRRRGLALALTTFAVGTAISRLVFQQPAATTGVVLDRTGLLGQDRFFYGVELALLAAALLLVRALRRGRIGRALGAMRDHEAGAAASGVDVPRLKLLAFVVGAALAALGGGLLGLGGQAFDPNAFDPILGLIWFAAVVVFGADSAVGAVLAAALLVGLDTGTVAGVSTAAIGALALLLGRMPPGGLAGLGRRQSRAGAGAGAAEGPVVGGSPAGGSVAGGSLAGGSLPGAEELRLTPLGRRLAERVPGRVPGPGAASVAEAVLTRSAGERLTARNVTRRFAGVTAVDGVTLAVPPGRITALTGPNGAGKSTLFDCLSGAARPDAGQVLLGGRDITRLPEHARARLGLARTFQQLAVFPGLTVADNIRVGAEQAAAARRKPGRGATTPAEETEAVLRLLGLSALRDHAAADLPTGTLRLVELGRALAMAPTVLLLDEPAAGLDRRETALLVKLLHSLADGGLALLLVEHDRELVDELASGVHVMRAGRAQFQAGRVRQEGGAVNRRA